VRLGEAAQATYSSQHPPVKNQQDYVIVLAQKNAMGLYPQNNIGTSIIAKGNKEDPRTGPTGSVNFTIFQTGYVMMIEIPKTSLMAINKGHMRYKCMKGQC